MKRVFNKALVYEFEGDTSLSALAKEYATDVTVITATDDYQNVLKKEHLTGVEVFFVGVFDDFKNEYWDLDTLKYICMDWTDQSMFDLKFLEEHNIAITNVSGQATEGVAQLMISQLLNLIRHNPASMAYAKDGGVSFGEYKGSEIGSKKIAIHGLGSIGGRFAEICDFFGSTVSYTARTKKNVPYAYSSLKEIAAGADVLAVTTSLTDETKSSIGTDELHGLNPNAVILCPGLFEAFKEDDLYGFLVARPDVQFWSDVNASPEWKACKDKFLALPNFYATPHTGFFTEENRPRALKLVRENVEAFVN